MKTMMNLYTKERIGDNYVTSNYGIKFMFRIVSNLINNQGNLTGFSFSFVYAKNTVPLIEKIGILQIIKEDKCMSKFEIREAIKECEMAYFETGDELYMDELISLKAELSKVES